MMTTPDWVRDAVFYQIFPDRFARSATAALPLGAGGLRLQRWGAAPDRESFQGGNLDGVIERLEHIQALGANAIFFNPIFASAANHRYATVDYFQVDPLLGGNEALHRLLDAAHARGMRVILDGVFNHCGRGLFQFYHLLEAGAASPYVDWFRPHGWPLNAFNKKPVNYAAWWNARSLPKFNTDTQAVREFLWGIGTYWLEQGIDGWRLDVPDEINDHDFWREFRRRCHAVRPDAYIVAELWNEATDWLQGDTFDAQMNYLLTRSVLGYLVGDRLPYEMIEHMGYGRIRPRDGRALAAELDHMFNQLYSPDVAFAQMNMLGSHDTPRLMTLCGNDETAVRLAFLIQMTAIGAPNIYYGDEIGMEGGADPDCRRAFPWHEPSGWNRALLDDISGYVALRHRLPALRRGSFAVVHAGEQLVVYERRLEQQSVIVALNGSHAAATYTPDTRGRDYQPEIAIGLAGQPLTHGQALTLPARTMGVWSSAQ